MSLDQVAFSTELDARLEDWRSRAFCVALSGGLDSMVLLELMAAVSPAGLRAMHVDHGLHPASAAWAEFAGRRCDAIGVRFSAVTVNARAAPGLSPEARARTARYDAFMAALAPGEVLVTAHHADDQAETVLLQLLRGSGPAGLAAMPPIKRFAQGWLCRPLLGFARAALEDYARRSGLSWIEDPSNTSVAPDRNYLRRRVMPVLRARWPGMADTVGRSARHSAAAAALIERRAASDLAGCLRGRALSVAALRALPRDRAREVLRHWVGAQGLPSPDSRHAERVLDELLGDGDKRSGRVEWPGAAILRYREGLHLVDARDLERFAAPLVALRWHPARPLVLGAGLGTLHADPASEGGLAAGLFEGDGIEIRWRVGGERIRPGPGRPRRRLKSLLREAGVWPWMRQRVPLVYRGDRLLAVGDLWFSGDDRAAAGEPGVRIRWEARPALGPEASDTT